MIITIDPRVDTEEYNNEQTLKKHLEIKDMRNRGLCSSQGFRS